MLINKSVWIVFSLSLFSFQAAHALNPEEVQKVVAQVDDQQRNTGDYKSLALIEQKEKGKSPTVYEATVYRRDDEDKWMILFSKPSSEQGKGYLRIDKNLFLYDPRVGKWERRTERQGLVGTGGQRQDFDESRLVEEYNATFVGEGKIGKFDVFHLSFKQKEGRDLASPALELWVDKETKNILKRQEKAVSGKALRTIYYPKWEKKFSKSKNAEVFFPREIRIFDEVEKGNSTAVQIQDVSFDPLDANMFTKAWIESKAR